MNLECSLAAMRLLFLFERNVENERLGVPFDRKPFEVAKVRFFPAHEGVKVWKLHLLSLTTMVQIEVTSDMTVGEFDTKVRAKLGWGESGKLLLFTDEMHIFVENGNTRLGDVSVRERMSMFTSFLMN